MANKTPLVLYSGVPGQIRTGDGLDIAKLAYGAANQLLGVNAAANANEWKTIQGTTNEIDITHAAGSITIGIVDPLIAVKGGTGQSVYAVGDLLYASTTTILSKLPDVATGSYLASGGIGVAPAWATLNQAAVAGLTTGSSPTFASVLLSDLSDGYIPYRVAVGDLLGNSPIYTDGTNVGVGLSSLGVKLELMGAAATEIRIRRGDSTAPAAGIWFTGSDGASTAGNWQIGTNRIVGAGLFEINDGTTNRVIIDAIGNVRIGAAASPTGGTLGLVFGQGTAFSGLGANTAGIQAKDVSGTAEMFAVDEAAAATQISSHNFTMFNPDPTFELPWDHYSEHPYLGKKIGVDMYGAVKALEVLTGKKFIYIATLPTNAKRDWNVDQAALVAIEKERRVQKALNEEVIITDIVTAFISEEVMKEIEVDTGNTKRIYELDIGNKKIRVKTVPIMTTQKVGTGKFETKLKDDYRFDEVTGKIFRKKTREEVEASIVAPVAKAPPAWMKVRMSVQ